MQTPIQVATTTEHESDARRIATSLVANKLAACVQVSGPITSCYRWEGKVETADEWLCTIKTTREAYEAVERKILELHPYDEPEITALPIVAGSRGYLQWLYGNVGPAAEA